jgi:hypothetical protein
MSESKAGKKTKTIVVARPVVPPAESSTSNSRLKSLAGNGSTRGKLKTFAALGSEEDVEAYEKFISDQRTRSASMFHSSMSPNSNKAASRRRSTGKIFSDVKRQLSVSSAFSLASTKKDQLSGEEALAKLEAEKVAKRKRELTMQYRKWLKSLTVHERIQHQRQQNVLKKWEKINQDWEQFKTRTSKKLGKKEKDLVMSRASSYREHVEEYDALQKATPLAEKVGDDIWLVSLRNDGTRYVPVGNIFSGLFCPIRESSRLGPSIRRPLEARNKSLFNETNFETKKASKEEEEEED